MSSEAIYRAQCHCNIHLLLHDRAGTSASVIYTQVRDLTLQINEIAMDHGNLKIYTT